MTVRVAAFYRFARLPDFAGRRQALLTLCDAGGVRGTILLAPEGVNGTIAGTEDAVERVVAHLRALPGCAGMDVKDSRAATMPFHRMKVRLKREIVPLGVPGIDPAGGVGTYVAPADWNALIDDPDMIVIDTRNEYEVRIGSFAGAIDPGTGHFRDFPAWFDAHREALADKPVAMFCTGGIRCEKTTAFLKSRGIEDVYHLEGGILRYLAEVPAADSRWQGECFVFDERVAVGHGLAPGTHVLCRACRMPVGPAEQASPRYVEGVACPACHDRRDDTQRAGYAERHRQAALAEARGERHVGAQGLSETDPPS